MLIRKYDLALFALIAMLVAAPSARGDDAPPPASEVLAQVEQLSKGRSWTDLFDGRSLDGWFVLLEKKTRDEDPDKIWQVADGVLHIYKDTPAGKRVPYGVLVTDDEYSHYRLRLEYKWGEKKFAPRTKKPRDGGLLYHVVDARKVWPTSVECQIQEGDTADTHTVYTRIETPLAPVDDPKEYPRQYLGREAGGELTRVGLPGRVQRVLKSSTHERDGWNQVEVIVLGDRALHLVNGHLVNECLHMEGPAANGKGWQPLVRGRIALQAEAAELMYRNIELMDLSDDDVPVEEARGDEAPVSAAVHPRSPARSPAESLAAWHVREGYQVELVAAEPEVVDPVAIDWGADGRLWVVEMADYPLGTDGEGKPGGRVRYLEDTNGDGRYDASTLFLDGLSFPTGVMAWRGGVIVTAAPDILYAEDTDGDGRADVRRTLFSGFHEGNQQLRMNGLRWGLDNWIYCASGSHTPKYGADSKIKSHKTGELVAIGSRDFRFRPDTGQIEPVAGPSQFGRNRDDWGNWFGVQNSYPLWHYVHDDRYLRRNPHFAAPDARRLLSEKNPPVRAATPPEQRYHSVNHAGRYTSACSGMVYRDALLFARGDVQHAFSCEPVNNLVQHNRLTADGASFQMELAEPSAKYDFLASEDPWTRPVMVRTGPDGALWVVDMYRYIIEHPHWLPEVGKKELSPYLRLGDDRGRIYRVTANGRAPHDWSRFDRMSTTELVARLKSPNGWQRDMAQRLLLERRAPAAIAALEQLARQDENPLARLHAIYTLDGLGALDASLVTMFLEDPHPQLRRHALRLIEQLDEPSEELRGAVVALTADDDPRVRLQLAFTLGEWNGPAAADALGELAIAAAGDAYLTAAVMSSLHEQNVAGVFEYVLDRHTPNGADDLTLVAALLEQTIAFGHHDALRLLIRDGDERWPTAWRFSTVAAGLDALARSKQALPPETLEPLRPLLERARQLAANADAPEAERTAAVRLLLRDTTQRESDLKVAAALLTPQTERAVQAALVEHLARQPGADLGEVLLSGWSGYAPDRRAQVLGAVATRGPWTKSLLERIDQGTIAVGEIDAAARERLLAQGMSKTGDADLRHEVQQRFKSATNSDRGKVLDAFRSALKLPGDAQRGAVVFRNKCASCHKHGSIGAEIGPNLSAVTDRSPAAMFESILDPNRSIETKYLSYTAITDDGRVLTGIITVDSGNSLTLVGADGKPQVVLRNELDALQSSGKSLMPEGLEQDISPQDLADLLAMLAK